MFEPLQKQVDDWITTHTPGYFEPLMMLARLSEELGELSRAIGHRRGKRPKPGEKEGEVGEDRRLVVRPGLSRESAGDFAG
jgi:NTP pyrophosphatase (non-canonical NTP hydrolase)